MNTKKFFLLLISTIYSFNPILGNPKLHEEKQIQIKPTKQVNYVKPMAALAGSIGGLIATGYLVHKGITHFGKYGEKCEAIKATKVIKNKKGETFTFDEEGNVSVKDVFDNNITAEYKNPKQIPPNPYNISLEKKDGKYFVFVGLGLKGGGKCTRCGRQCKGQKCTGTTLEKCFEIFEKKQQAIQKALQKAERQARQAERQARQTLQQQTQEKGLSTGAKVAIAGGAAGVIGLGLYLFFNHTNQGQFMKGCAKAGWNAGNSDDED